MVGGDAERIVGWCPGQGLWVPLPLAQCRHGVFATGDSAAGGGQACVLWAASQGLTSTGPYDPALPQNHKCWDQACGPWLADCLCLCPTVVEDPIMPGVGSRDTREAEGPGL